MSSALYRSISHLENFLTDIVVAGGTLQMGTKAILLEGGNMVEHVLGVVYFYSPGCQIKVCYREVTETAKVNKFAQVYPEDLDNLRTVGKLVRERTMATGDRTIVRIKVNLIGLSSKPAIAKEPVITDPNHWRSVKADIEQAIDDNWHEEPDEIRLTRLGVIKSGAGTGGSSYPALFHDKAYLMVDGGTFYRYLKLARDDRVTLDTLKLFTNAIFFETFNHFVFFKDLGLETLANIGPRYQAALDTVQTKEEYIELTGPLVVLFNVFHRWVNLIYPWHHELQFPHRTEAQVANEPKLATYNGIEGMIVKSGSPVTIVLR